LLLTQFRRQLAYPLVQTIYFVAELVLFLSARFVLLLSVAGKACQQVAHCGKLGPDGSGFGAKLFGVPVKRLSHGAAFVDFGHNCPGQVHCPFNLFGELEFLAVFDGYINLVARNVACMACDEELS
jgi:hypothetical protein